MGDGQRRYVDTFIGGVIHLWPVLALMGGAFIYIYQKLNYHDTRLAVMEYQISQIDGTINDVKTDVRILIERRR